MKFGMGLAITVLGLAFSDSSFGACKVDTCHKDGKAYCCPFGSDALPAEKSSASLPGYYCEKAGGNIGDESVSLKFEDGIFQIAHWGHSRVSYLANYKVTDTTQTRTGSLYALTKVEDFSTFKDMPESLGLQHNTFVDESISLRGLLAQLVQFAPSDCHDLTTPSL